MSEFENWIKKQLLFKASFTTEEAMLAFKVTRITIMRWLKLYQIKEVYPLTYYKKTNSYILKQEYIFKDTSDVLLEAKSDSFKEKNQGWFYDASIHFIHPINDFLFPLLIQAIKEKKVLSIDYQTKKEEVKRVVSPLRIVFIHDRYHLRAFCHDKNKFLDFHLNRILDLNYAHKISFIDDTTDFEWHTLVDISFKINPALSQYEQNMVAQTYHIKNDIYTIKVRKALHHYAQEVLLNKKTKNKPYFIKI